MANRKEKDRCYEVGEVRRKQLTKVGIEWMMFYVAIHVNARE